MWSSIQTVEIRSVEFREISSKLSAKLFILENIHLSDAFPNASRDFLLEYSVWTQNHCQCTQSLEIAGLEAWPRVPHTVEGCLFLSSGDRLNSCFLLACLAVFCLMYAYEGQDPVEKMDLEETLKIYLLEETHSSHLGHSGWPRSSCSCSFAALSAAKWLVLYLG